MKKTLLFGAYFLSICAGLKAQSYAVIVNGGQFGTPNNNVNVQLYDPVVDSSWVIDTIQTQSVQDLLINGNIAYVAAQDSIVRYDLTNQTRTHAAAFNGPSTYTLELDQNRLLVGNWFGASTDNLYIYDASNLTLLDSVSAISEDAKSILVKNGFAFITQNLSTSGFQDTLGYIIRLDLSNLSITDTLSVANYSGDIGQLVEKPNGSGFYTLNSVSNTIGSFDFASPFNGANSPAGINLRVDKPTQWVRHTDTLYARMESGIGAINLNNLSIIDTSFIDTVVTAFSYDTSNSQFYVTQTDFFSFTFGKVYDRNGVKQSDFTVGFSPEVVGVFYTSPIGIEENLQSILSVNAYPNPASDIFYIENAKEGDLIRLIDLSGKLVLENRISYQGQAFDVSTLNSGTYILMLQSNNEISTTKLIVD